MNNIHELLEKLRLTYENIGCPVSQALQPALTENELKKEFQWFPAELPDSIKSLYTWRSGQDDSLLETNELFWFRDMVFACPKVVKYEYDSMVQHYGQTPDEDGIDLKTCFPFASFNGGWYVVPTSQTKWSNKFTHPVICVLEGINLHFHSIETMLQTCIEWVENSTYQVEDEYLELDPILEKHIWNKYNPDP